MSNVALITGTSSGMGLYTAVELARRGHQVVATMRDTRRGEALRNAASEAGVELDIRPLDVTDPESLRACIEEVLADYGRIDVLLNNAGHGAVGSAEMLDMEEIARSSRSTTWDRAVTATSGSVPERIGRAWRNGA